MYLAAGPSYNVWTTSLTTEAWFSSTLLSTPAADSTTNTKTATDDIATQDWLAFARAQSPIGILMKFEDETPASSGPRITEILFYGTVALPSTSPASLLTPPSSSPRLAEDQPETLPKLHVYALPFSSDLLYTQPALQEAPPSPRRTTPERNIDPEPHFLPATRISAPKFSSPKQKRDIFEEATQARKKARAIDGEVSQQHSSAHRKSLSIDTKAMYSYDSRPKSANGLPQSRHLSRSPSISFDIRPLSRKGTSDTNARRSTLSQVATVPLRPEEPTLESRNKEALSRVVMAAMRMQGLQQRKKSKSRRGSAATDAEDQARLGEETAAEEAAKEEEYKQIYHQTYEAAIFTLVGRLGTLSQTQINSLQRKHMASKPLHTQPDQLRQVAERLLAIFCSDPLDQPLLNNVADHLTTPAGKQSLGVHACTYSHASPFDQPSGSRQSTTKNSSGDVRTGSPSRKQRK